VGPVISFSKALTPGRKDMRPHRAALIVLIALSCWSCKDGFVGEAGVSATSEDQSRETGQAAAIAVAKAARTDADGDAAKQRKTVADMRNLGSALFSWLTDQVGAGAAGQQAAMDLALYPDISRAELRKLLVPQYIIEISELDGWGHPYEIRLNAQDVLARNVMSIRSPGRDGRYSADVYTVQEIETADYDQDIVWADGYFVRWPRKQTGPAIDPTPKVVPVPRLENDETDAAPDTVSAESEITNSSTDEQRQLKTVADMRNLGTAMFSWLTDQVGAGAAGQQEVEIQLYPYISGADLERLLVPQYLERVPKLDGWGNPFEVRLSVQDTLAQHVMSIRSAGRDGQYSTDVYKQGSFEPMDYSQDIVWADGFFVRWPQRDH
jgi:hypothetical protein